MPRRRRTPLPPPEPKPASPIPATANGDPYAHDPQRWVGKIVRFNHNGLRLVGTVTAQRFAGRTQRGNLPDYTLTIRGSSGKTLDISLVETRASFD